MTAIERKKEVATVLRQTGVAAHIDMLEAIKEPTSIILHCDAQGILIRYNGAYMLSVFALSAVRLFDKYLPLQGNGPIVVRQAFERQHLQDRGYKEEIRCVTAFYDGPQLSEADLPTFITFSKLVPDDLDFIWNYYHELATEAYLTDRLEKGVMTAVTSKGKKAGFIGIHQEGALGMLEILPEYRRKGYAAMLERHVMNQLIANGKIPYAHIKSDNEPSLALHRKLGFSFAKEEISWF
jgi:tRNA (guanine37-N1)-methyltransferase